LGVRPACRLVASLKETDQFGGRAELHALSRADVFGLAPQRFVRRVRTGRVSDPDEEVGALFHGLSSGLASADAARLQSAPAPASARQDAVKTMKQNEMQPGHSLTLQTLGGLVLRRGDTVLASGRKPLAVLAWLACRGAAQERARLADVFWEGDDERRARQSLRQALLTLRGLLGPTALELDGEHVALRAGALEVDVLSFAGDVQAGRDALAAARWTGDFLSGLEEAGGEAWRAWLDAERQRLRALLGLACERRAHAARAQGDWPAAVAATEQWCDAVHVDEAAHVQLLDCLLLADRASDAAATAQTLIGRWRELELEPPVAVLKAAEAADAAARAAAAIPRLPTSVALFSPALIDRGDVLAELAAIWRAVAEGAGAGVLIEGPVGSGRTRVVDELDRVARQTEPPVTLRAACYDDESDVRWGTLRDLLEPLCSAPGLSGAPDADLAVLATYSTRLRERYPRLPQAQHGQAAEPADVARALIRVLGDVAAESPILLIVDDVEACDDASRAVLCSLLRRVPPRVLVVLTADDAIPQADLHELTARGPLRRIRLAPLDRGGTEAMIRSMLELPASERGWLASRLHEETGGNPLAVAGMLAALADDGLVRPALDGWQLDPELRSGSLPLPDSVRTAVLRRIARLTPDARLLLEAAARTPSTADALRGATALDEGAFEAALQLLLTGRLLRAAPIGTGDALQPAHPLLRRIVLEEANRARTPYDARTMDATAPPAGTGRTLRRGWRYTAAAATVLIGLFSLRMIAPRPAPSLDTIAVLPFTVHGESSLAYLGEGLMDLLGVSINGAAGLRTVDPHALLVNAPPGTVLSPSAARRLAARFGAGTYITGSVVEGDGALRLRASIHEGGGRPTVVEVQAPVETELFAVVDELARKVLASLLAEHDGRALPATQSLPGLRAYLAGRQSFRRGHYAEAGDHFRTAIRHDSLFALAHYQLALATEFSGEMDPLIFSATIANALRHMDGLPWRERELLQAFADIHSGSAAAAEARLRGVIAEYANDVDAWYSLAEVLFHAGPRLARPGALPAARAAFERVLQLDPVHAEALLHLVRIAVAQKDTAAADEYLQRLRHSSIAGTAIVGSTEAFHTFATADARQQAEQADALRERPAVLILVPALFLAAYAQAPLAAAEVAALALTAERPALQRAAAHTFRAVMFASVGALDSARAELAVAAVLHPRRAAHTAAFIATAPGSDFTDAERRNLLATLETFEDEDGHAVDDLRYLGHVPGMDVAFDLHSMGLLHVALGELARASHSIS
jgi:DNA-binding SARP family transcriptional activator/tetratricopeptide (TPR) repeat protein